MTKVILLLLVLSMLVTGICVAQDDSLEESDFPVLTGPYLGQEPPGEIPEIFAPGIVSTALNEHSCTFSPSGDEFYFTRILNDVPTIMCTRQVNGSWSVPGVATFSGSYLDRLPQMSPDGTTIYFQSRRPRPGHHSPGEISIWVSTRTDSEDWKESKPLIADLSMKNAGISVAVASNGTLYASGIVRLRPEDRDYAKPERLTPDLNGTYPFIAPDESYILYCSGKQRDLVVSFHRPDDSWTEPQLILEQQEPFWIQGFPIVSPDRKYLFFTADHDIYWVSAKIIEELRPKELK